MVDRLRAEEAATAPSRAVPASSPIPSASPSTPRTDAEPTPREEENRTTETPSASRGRRFSVNAVLDQCFFVLGGLSAVWLAWLIFDEGLHSGWGQIWFYILLWVLVAYLVLPRLHRILTQLYVPNYFIGRARTSDGLLGDPVNLAFRGTEEQLVTAMTTAGWTRADEVTLTSSWRIVASTLTRRSYHEAPVSPLFVFGVQQNLAYQQEVEGNPAKRHHVRFWHCPEGWMLPGGYAVDWIAAGTFDRAVGLSLFTLQVTHRIDPDTDVERDHIVDSLRDADERISVDVIRDFSTGYHSRNGGGDSIVTDGGLPIVDLRTVIPGSSQATATATGEDDLGASPAASSPGSSPSPPEGAFSSGRSRIRRPATTVVGSVMIFARALTGFVSIVFIELGVVTLSDLTIDEGGLDQDDASALKLIVVVALSLVYLVEALLAALVLRGSNGARIVAMTLSALSTISAFIVVLQGGAAISLQTNLLTVSFDVLVLLALSSRSSRTYARTP